MNLKVSGLMVIAALAMLLGNSASTEQNQTANSTQKCLELLQHAEQQNTLQACSREADSVSWAAWFSGESRSTQFHFLDLAELLFGGESKRDFQPTQPN